MIKLRHLESKNLASCHEFAKFANIFPLQIFSAYGTWKTDKQFACRQKILLTAFKKSLGYTYVNHVCVHEHIWLSCYAQKTSLWFCIIKYSPESHSCILQWWSHESYYQRQTCYWSWPQNYMVPYTAPIIHMFFNECKFSLSRLQCFNMTINAKLQKKYMNCWNKKYIW